MSRQYRKPPILEATFECHFDRAQWSLGAPAALYERIAEWYPADPAVISTANLEIRGNENESPSVNFSPAKVAIYQFASQDGHHLVRASQDLLSAHVLAPYTGWGDFKPHVIRALRAYIDIVKPVTITRMSVRYVNRINLDQDSSDLVDYLNIPAGLPDEQGFSLKQFFYRAENVRADGIKLITTFANNPGESPAVLLDLDVIDDQPNANIESDDALIKRIDALRDIERDVFESLITQRLREAFDAENTV